MSNAPRSTRAGCRLFDAGTPAAPLSGTSSDAEPAAAADGTRIGSVGRSVDTAGGAIAGLRCVIGCPMGAADLRSAGAAGFAGATAPGLPTAGETGFVTVTGACLRTAGEAGFVTAMGAGCGAGPDAGLSSAVNVSLRAAVGDDLRPGDNACSASDDVCPNVEVRLRSGSGVGARSVARSGLRSGNSADGWSTIGVGLRSRAEAGLR